MGKRIPQEFKDQHVAKYSKRYIGSGWNNHALYAWSFVCSCGYEKKTNESKGACAGYHKDHVRECYEKQATP